jgi:UDP-N-acetylmuramoylalanine--D-glutamate ligase
MRVLIFGLGILGGGFASASYFLDHGDEVRITDLRSEKELGNPIQMLKEKGATLVCGKHREEDFLWADLVVKNPAVSPKSPYLVHAKRVTSDIAYFMSSPLVDSLKAIAVTGTKGKTTTVATVTHILNATGHETVQLGNMGISGFSVLMNFEERLHNGRALPEYVILELSSWQIRDLYASMGPKIPNFHLVALTSLFPDHLNNYVDYQSYKDDKWLLFGSRNTRMIVPKNVYSEVMEISDIKSRHVRTTESFLGAEKISVKIRTAWSICRSLRLGIKQISEALLTFRGVPHRQEQLGVKNHVVFINDSSATIPEAVTFSCANCPWAYHLICGGTDKNLKPDGMLQAARDASSVYLLDGSFTKDKLIPFLTEHDIPYSGPFSSLKEAFDKAYKAAKSDTAILPHVALILSPGGASFGMFRHEFDRGDQFRRLFEAVEDIDR